MAKLISHNRLCPLIDLQNLLGAEIDAEAGCAIVTLGRNITIRYKLKDLKQVGSWSSKERFTSQVIYDNKTKNYAAIFNESHIRTWKKDETDLDEVKRKKFNNPFLVILSSNDGTVIVVRNDGATASLEWALKNRKTWTDIGFLKSNEKLSDCRIITVNNQTYICGLIRTESTCSYIVAGLQQDTYLIDYELITKIELKRVSEQLVGHVVVQDNNNAYLLTLWSHGRLYSYPLTGTSSNAVPGMLISVFSSISTKNPVLMIALNESTIAAYGANTNEEGAVLIIYNIQFKLVQAIENLKLYTKDAKLWRIEDKLLLAENQHLRVVSYRLASQRIETMLGSSLRFKENDKKQNDNDVVEIQETIIANWENTEFVPRQLSMNDLPKYISKQIDAYLNEGTSDASIQEAIIPQLIEKKDIKTIIWCLDNLNDQPEKILTDLLAFCLRTGDETFKQIQNGTSGEKKKSSIPTRNEFLDRLFSSNFYDLSLLSYLQSELKFDEILKLMNYIIEKLNVDDCGDDDNDDGSCRPSDKQLYEWASLLLDSHYLDYLLPQEAHVHTMLSKLEEILSNHKQYLQEVEDLRPMFYRLSNGKSVKLANTDFNKFYSIEEVQLC